MPVKHSLQTQLLLAPHACRVKPHQVLLLHRRIENHNSMASTVTKSHKAATRTIKALANTSVSDNAGHPWKALSRVLKLIIFVFILKGSKYSDKVDHRHLYCDILEHITQEVYSTFPKGCATRRHSQPAHTMAVRATSKIPCPSVLHPTQ